MRNLEKVRNQDEEFLKKNFERNAKNNFRGQKFEKNKDRMNEMRVLIKKFGKKFSRKLVNIEIYKERG